MKYSMSHPRLKTYKSVEYPTYISVAYSTYI